MNCLRFVIRMRKRAGDGRPLPFESLYWLINKISISQFCGMDVLFYRVSERKLDVRCEVLFRTSRENSASLRII